LDKSPDAFRTISEVATDLDLPQHVLRFWETRFVQIKPLKRGGGRRYYRPDDIDLLKGIRHLLYGEGYTIRGVQRILKEQGVRFVTEVWREGAPQPPPAGGRWDGEAGGDRAPAVDDWAADNEAEPAEAASYDEPTTDWAEPEGAWSAAAESEAAWTPSVDETSGAAPSPAEPVPSAPAHTPFAIGRATPLDPAFRARRDGLAAPEAEQGFEATDDAEELRSAQAMAQRFAPRAPGGGDASRRADRIAGFGAAPQAPRPFPADPRAPEPPRSGAPEVTPLRPGLDGGRGPVIDPATGRPAFDPPPLASGGSERPPSRLPAGLRPSSPTNEPPRSGIGHLLDRLRPGASLGAVSGESAAPSLRAVQSLSRDEIRRLQSTLFELLECKRLLDQIR